MLDVLSIKYNNIPMVVFKIIALDLLVIRHCRVNCNIEEGVAYKHKFHIFGTGKSGML